MLKLSGSILILLLSGCSGSNEPPPETERASGEAESAPVPRVDKDSAAAAAQDTAVRPAMPGMDHSKMSEPPKAGAAPMAGHDLSRMRPAASSAAGHEGMSMPAGRRRPVADHSRMDMRTGGPARADHSNMPGMNAPRAGNTMPGMQHAISPAPAPGDSAATQKLQELARALMRDPAIVERVESNDSLRRAWQNPAVQKLIRRN